MKASEKLLGELDRSLAELGKKDPSPSELRNFAEQCFGVLPAAARDQLSLSFEGRWAADRAAAGAWATAVGSILGEDYDGTELAAADWRELRDVLSGASEELDMDLLGYTMGLVLEHKAL